jgi:hypothetical protein
MNFFRRPFVIILIIICLSNIYISSNAQTAHSLGNWNSVILKAKISQRWSLMGEGHIRSCTYGLKYDYFEVKTGVSYAFTKKLTGLFGAGFYNTDLPGGFFRTPAQQKELRTWFEIAYKQAYKRLKFDHRVRIEQRFIAENYKNRLRYLFGLTVPVNKAESIEKSIYIAVNDELWIPQYGLFMEKNRLFAGAGYKMNDKVTWQIGCISDTDYKPGSHAVKNYLQLSLIYDLSKLIKKHT